MARGTDIKAIVLSKNHVSKQEKPEILADTDIVLLRRAARGDETAFEELIKRYERAVFTTVYRYIGKPEDVEELAQEVFLKVWRNAAKFKERSSFSTWLFRITVNHCLNHKAKKINRTQHVSIEEISVSDNVPVGLKTNPPHDQNRRLVIIQQAIIELPKRQRVAFILAQYEDKSHQEIAEIMKVSVSSVHSLIFRARVELQKKLKHLVGK